MMHLLNLLKKKPRLLSFKKYIFNYITKTMNKKIYDYF